MENAFKKFYRGFFLKTGGFLPTRPFNGTVLPGDLFQIQDGQTVVLGNIYRQGLTDPANYSILAGLNLNPAGWRFSEGFSQAYLGTENRTHNGGEQETFRREVLAFKGRGSHLFQGDAPETVRIGNWSEIADQLIIKLTTTQFSFREVYVVTEAATTASWALAVCGGSFGKLELVSDEEDSPLGSLFGHLSSQRTQMREMAYFHRETVRRPSFFRAKKLVVRHDKVQRFVTELVAQQTYDNSWTREFFEYDIFPSGQPYPAPMTPPAQASVLDMLQATQLNPNTALEYFRWEDTSLNDVERLFPSHGL